VIYGKVNNSIISDGVYVGKNTEVVDSVIFPNVVIGDNCKLYKVMIGGNAVIGDHCVINDREDENREDAISSFISEYCTGGVTLIGRDIKISGNTVICPNSMVDKDITNSAAPKGDDCK
jgi:glucose-1-phosphate adenylyltransferase